MSSRELPAVMSSQEPRSVTLRRPPGPRRIAAILAGYRSDEACAREHLDDPSPTVRAAALGALARSNHMDLMDLNRGFTDQDPQVRRRTCEIAARRSRFAGREHDKRALAAEIVHLLEDPDDLVCESAAWALGELCENRSSASTVALDVLEALHAVACNHRSPLCREAAVAALGTIGDPKTLASIIQALSDRPQVRRRAVVALAAFDHPDAEAAMKSCLADRDWQVRQSAEELLALD